MAYYTIIGLSKKYLKTGDQFWPECQEGTFSVQGTATWALIADTDDAIRVAKTGKYFNQDSYVLDTDPEGYYNLLTMWIDSSPSILTYYAQKTPFRFWILHEPTIKTFEISSQNKKTISIYWKSDNLELSNAYIEWGDGTKETVKYDILTATHTYEEFRNYQISLYIDNKAELQSIVYTITAHLVEIETLSKTYTIYLMNEGKVVKPILDYISWQCIFTNKNTVLEMQISGNSFEDYKVGMFIYMYIDIIPSLFVINVINFDGGIITLTATDLLSSLMASRISYTNTDKNDGYVRHNGYAGTIIPRILNENLIPNERGCDFLALPKEESKGKIITTCQRFQLVKNVIEDVIDSSGLSLYTYVEAIQSLSAQIKMYFGSEKNVCLTSDRGCGKWRTLVDKTQPTIVLVAMENEGAERKTQWVGSKEEKNLYRIEAFLDGENTNKPEEIGKTFLENQEGDSIQYDIWPTCPYNIAPNGDFWIGDYIWIEASGRKKMRVDSYDIAYSSEGLTRVVTLGIPQTTIEKDVTLLTDGIVSHRN